MALCKNFSVTLMVFINTIFALLGICVVGISSYGLATLEQWKEFIDQGGLVVGVIFGLVIFLISLMGCVGAIKQNKACLGIYMLFELIVTIVMIAAAAGALIYGGSVTRADTVVGRTVSNSVVQMYYECCTRPAINMDSLTYHSESGNTKDVKTGCITDKSLCAPPTCKASYCAQDKSKYQVTRCMFPYCSDATGNNDCCSQVDPAELIAKASSSSPLCVSINQLIFKGSTSEEQKACADVDIYGGRVMAFIRDNMQMFGIGCAVIASILLLLFVSSVALCCIHKDNFDATA
jgi:hypothetical protein